MKWTNTFGIHVEYEYQIMRSARTIIVCTVRSTKLTEHQNPSIKLYCVMNKVRVKQRNQKQVGENIQVPRLQHSFGKYHSEACCSEHG